MGGHSFGVRLTFRAQLLVAFTLSSSIPLLLLGVTQISETQAQLNKQTSRELTLAAESTAIQVRTVVENTVAVMRTAALEAAAESSSAELTDTFERFLRHHPEIYILFKLTPEGRVAASFPEISERGGRVKDLNYGDRSYFQQVVAGADVVVSNVLDAKSRDGKTFAIAVAARDQRANLKSVTAAGIDLPALGLQLKEATAGISELEILLLDENDQVVVSSNPSLNADSASKTFAANLGRTELRRGVGSDGVEYEVAIRPLIDANIPWRVAAVRPLAYQASLRNESLRALAVAFVVVLVAGLIVALLLSEGVARPIRHAMKQMAALERGELSAIENDRSRLSTEEMVVFARVTERAAHRLRVLIDELKRSSERMSHLNTSLGENGAVLRQSSRENRRAIDDSLEVLGELRLAADAINASVGELSDYAEGTADSAGLLEGAASSIVTSMEPLSEAIEDVVHSVQQLDLHTGGVSKGMSTMNRSVDHVAASLRSLEQTSESVRISAGKSADLAEQTTRDAQHGRDATGETIRAVKAIRASFDRLSDSIHSLSARSVAINRVIVVIQDVTRATNLLAFNASIIAAKAGEHGAGFYVVAERVKSLADSTRQSTAEIGELVIDVRDEIHRAAKELDESRRSIHDGEARSVEAEESLSVIIESSEQAAAMVQQIFEASEAQNRRFRELKSNVDELREIRSSVENAASEQRAATELIASSVLNVRDINERVGATARAQAGETRSIATAMQHIDGRIRRIGADSEHQKVGTVHLQSTMERFAELAQSNLNQSVELERLVRELTVWVQSLDETLSPFK